MRRSVRRAPALLLLALLGGCAPPRPTATAAPATNPESVFYGISGVDVLVFTALPDPYAEPRGLRAPAVRQRVLARLAAAGIPLRADAEPFDMNQPNFRLDVESLQFAPDEHAVWLRVSLGETTRLRRRPERPLMITTWARAMPSIRSTPTSNCRVSTETISSEWISSAAKIRSA